MSRCVILTGSEPFAQSWKHHTSAVELSGGNTRGALSISPHHHGQKSNDNDWYETKHGRICVFNGDNYADWVRDVEAALAVSGALPYVVGDQKEDENASEAERRVARHREGRSYSTLFPRTVKRDISGPSNLRDIIGMRPAIARRSNANKPAYVYGLRHQFA